MWMLMVHRWTNVSFIEEKEEEPEKGMHIYYYIYFSKLIPPIRIS